MNREELIKEMDRVCSEYMNHIITSKQIEYHILDKIKALEVKAATIIWDLEGREEDVRRSSGDC